MDEISAKSLKTFKVNLASKAKLEQLHGVDHLVVPVIAAKEMVMNKLLYTEAEMRKSIENWNNVPVTVNHPRLNGSNVSANSPSVLDKFQIGSFFNVKYEDGIKGEIWVNIAQAKEKGFEAITESLQNGEVLEVSTGLLSGLQESKGIFNEKSYDGIVNTILPDHLAILLNEEGACSVSDGCGAYRTNCGCKELESASVDNKEMTTNESILSKAMEIIKGKISSLKSNELSLDDRRSQLETLVRDIRGSNSMSWVNHVFSDHAIISSDSKLFRVKYTVGNDIVSISDELDEVVGITSFKTKDGMAVNKEKGELFMSKEELLKKVTANCKCSDADKEVMANLSIETLSKMAKVNDAGDEQATEEAPASEEAAPAESPAEDVKADAPATEADVIGNISDPEMKAVFSNLLKERENKKATLVSGLVTNSKFTESELKEFPVETLEKLQNSIKPEADYSARGGSIDSTSSKQEIPNMLERIANEKTDEKGVK